MEKIKMDFKRFGIWIGSFLMKKIEKMKIFRRIIAALLIVISFVYLVTIYSSSSLWFEGVGGLDLATFIITLIAFLAAAYAIWQQHIALKHQKEAGIKQEINGAWQVLANKAAGNSGKIEAIEFLAKQGKSLQGIDMSVKKHDGQVYLVGLNLSKKELGKEAKLVEAHFEGAILCDTNFEEAYLERAHFEGAYLCETNFEGVPLRPAHFEKANLQGAHFEKANLQSVNFKGACLDSVHFEGAYLYGANFEGANLRLTKFEGAQFKLTIFRDDKSRIVIRMAGKMTNFKGAYLLYANFKGADLEAANFEGAYLEGAHFEGSNLQEVHFEGAKNLNPEFFQNSFVAVNSKNYLPKTAPNDKFEFEFDTEKKPEKRLDKDGKPTGSIKYFIQLVHKTPK